MDSLKLFVCPTHDTLTLYWDKPESAAAQQTYTVTLDGRGIVQTTCTHCTIEGLAPKTRYELGVTCETEAGTISLTAQAETTARRRRIDVTQPPYGARGDGQTLNTAALQRAFDDCGKGDCVYFPAGVYMTGALRGHSDMEILLDEGAVLQGTANVEDYLPRIPSRFEGYEMACYSSVLNFGHMDHASGPNCENVLIHGRGTIASGGQMLCLRVIDSERERLKDYLAENAALVATCENDHTIPGRVRPRLINLSNCRNVRISGLTLQNGASWNVHMIYCDEVVTDHCVFRSEGVWNGDGWAPDSSEHCTLFASAFYTGDDAVAIKSGKNPEGNVIARPSRHIRVFDCTSAFGHGIVMGSEMSGGIEDVRIWDCDLRVSMSGLEIKATKKRGGYVRDILVRDCVMPRVMMHAVPYNDDGVGAPVPPVLSDCRFERLTLTGLYQAAHDGGDMRPCSAIELTGFDVPGHEIDRIAFRNVVIANSALGVEMKHVKHVTLENIACIEEV